MMCNNLKLDHVNINAYINFGETMSSSSQDNMNAYIKFGENLPIGSQDIERKRNFGINQGP